MEPDFFLDVDLDDDVKLDDYNDALSTYKEWKSIYREIKLNLLLEQGKRIEFDIDNISKFITLDNDDDVVRVKNICCNHLFFNMIPTSLQEHRDKQLEKIIPKK